jgi:hypothetical protein
MTLPLMPKATAVWLVENTALTFSQIAAFCGLHALEVQAIADEEVAVGIVGLDPIANGQLTAEEIQRCEKDPDGELEMAEAKTPRPSPKTKGPRYTPVAKRQERPDAIAWLLRHYPELADAQISKLVGTTKNTINSVRDRTHWKGANIKPVDPVDIGMCSYEELLAAVQLARRRRTQAEARAAKQAAKQGRASGAVAEATAGDGTGVLVEATTTPAPAAGFEAEPETPTETIADPFGAPVQDAPKPEPEPEPTVDDVFGPAPTTEQPPQRAESQDNTEESEDPPTDKPKE